MFYKLATRDLISFVLLLVLWQWLAPLSAEQGLMGDFIGVSLGGLMALAFYLTHEWGHVLGGILGRSHMSAASDPKAISLFIYHSEGNSKPQFMLMSFGGFLATACLVWFSYTLLPADLFASRIAQGFSLVQVFLALVLEMPLVIWALFAKKLPPIDSPMDKATIANLLSKNN